MSPLIPIFMTRACCALIMSALLPFPAGAAPIKLKFSFFSSDREYAYESVVKPFVNAVNLEGKGIVEIELFPSGALGRELCTTGATGSQWRRGYRLDQPGADARAVSR